MADTTSHAFFYNSDNGDRVYDADSFEHLLKRFFTTGVFTGCCKVSAMESGMIVQMGSGYSNVDGKVRFFGEVQELALQNAHATYDRIDTIVIERNDIDRDITAKVITGNYSASPVATAPVRTGGIYQLVVAEIYVQGGAVKITDANITDKRPDTSVCGYVMCAVDTPDFSELYAQFTTQAAEVISNTTERLDEWEDGFESDAEQWKETFESEAEKWEGDFESTAGNWYNVQTADFIAWYERMKDQLSEDAAGHLQGEIDALQAEVNTHEGDIGDEYDETATYAVGKYCIHDHQIYRCTTAIEDPEEWDSAHWTAVNIGDELAAKAAEIETEAIARSEADTSLNNQIAKIIQQSVWTLEESDGDFILFWHGAEGECPFSTELVGTDYVLNFTYET